VLIQEFKDIDDKIKYISNIMKLDDILEPYPKSKFFGRIVDIFS